MFGVKTPDWEALRDQMVSQQLQTRGIVSARVLEAMRRTPRHYFVPPDLRHRAYEDRALGVGHGQTISQPYIVAYMLQQLALIGTENVLEIGTGTGYQAALLGQLAAQVKTMDIVPELVERARALIGELGLSNVEVLLGDGSQGLPDEAPFDVIIVAAGAPDIPPRLVDQLALGGKLILPIGDRKQQHLTLVRKTPSGLTRETLGACSFVPLLGAHGWPA